MASMSQWTGEIEPASIEQIKAGRDGKMHLITQDAGGIAQRLQEIDERLHLRYSEAGQYYVVYARELDQQPGSGYMVATYQELDGRIVRDLERINWLNQQPDYSYADELEKQHQLAEAARDWEFSQKIGENAEKLAFAIRKDLGYDQDTAVITKDIPSNTQ
jgi:hypothetical protein